MAKRFRSDKMDGRYLPEVSGQLEVWNWRPKVLASLLAGEICHQKINWPRR